MIIALNPPWLQEFVKEAGYMTGETITGQEKIEQAKREERERIGKGLDNRFAGRLASERMAAGRVMEYIAQALEEAGV